MWIISDGARQQQRLSTEAVQTLFGSHPTGQSGLLELIVYFSLGKVCMYETDDRNTECGLDRKLVGILVPGFILTVVACLRRPVVRRAVIWHFSPHRMSFFMHTRTPSCFLKRPF